MSIDSSGEAVLASPEHNAAAMCFGCYVTVCRYDAPANMVKSTNASVKRDA
jgi:hypothetical protein